MPPGRVLSQTEQALGALNALIQVLGPEAGPQVRGLVEGHYPRNQPLQFPPHPPMLKWWPAFMNFMILRRKGKKKVEEAQGTVGDGSGSGFTG